MARRAKPNQNGRGFSLRLGLLGIVAGCWILPMALVLASLFYYTAQGARRQFDETVRVSVGNAAASCRRAMREAVDASRDASYDGAVRGFYTAFGEHGNSQLLYEQVTRYLLENYQYDNNFASTVLFFRAAPNTEYYTFNPELDASFTNIRNYRQSVHESVLAVSRDLGTRIAFLNTGGGVYMVRNIVDSAFTPYATIVTELDREIFFGGFSGILWETGATVYINRVAVNVPANAETPEAAAISFPEALRLSNGEQAVVGQGGRNIVYGRESIDSVDILYALEVDMQAFLRGFFSFANVIYILLILTAPLILLAVQFFYRNIFKPVENLSLAAGKIQKGELGYEVLDRAENREFDYLTAAFNDMSARLKRQFERIYSEELALRDARIMALQSQINPHFLNNTLEIINWEVRLGNNEGVSRLIEALSTMLDAAMDRRNAPLIPLAQEMMYVDSYLYIVSERFGKRLAVRKAVAGEALCCKVPRLIMQPLIENAVEHGVEKQRAGGEILIAATVESDHVTLSVRNNTPLSEKDARTVAQLLSPEYDPKSGGSLHLGIHNVNMRLKMIYGDGVSLRIYGEEGGTVSTFTIPLEANYPIPQ